MQTIGDLIDKAIELSVEHLRGASYSKEEIKSKLLKVPGAKTYCNRVLTPKKSVTVKQQAFSCVSDQEYQILTIIAEYYKVSVNEIRSVKRTRKLVEIRMQAMVIFYVHLNYTLKTTARVFMRDHTTVIHAVNTTSNLLDCDVRFSDSFMETIKQLEKEMPHLFNLNTNSKESFKQIFAKRRVSSGTSNRGAYGDECLNKQKFNNRKS